MLEPVNRHRQEARTPQAQNFSVPPPRGRENGMLIAIDRPPRTIPVFAAFGFRSRVVERFLPEELFFAFAIARPFLASIGG